jgi:beta-glucosidase
VGPDPDVRGPFAGDRAAEVAYEDDIWVGYRHFATKGVTPAYPFGFGMSYAAFGYSGLKVSPPGSDKKMTAVVTVTNTGKVAGREVVQMYVSAPGQSMPKPALELRGFAKTGLLAPGASQVMTFTLSPRDLASFDAASASWKVEAGTYTVKVGASSADIRQTATFTRAAESIDRSSR